jgi:hypothetical protein
MQRPLSSSWTSALDPPTCADVIAVSAFREPKAGCSSEEYEDALAWSRRRRRFAVADGASASAFARLWAQLLVRAYVGGCLSAESLEADLVPAQTRWAEHVDERQLPWYTAEQARRGAFAALAGLTLQADGIWSALAVGDCCVFQVRGEALVTAFPLADAADFDNRPLLLGSRAISNAVLRDADGIKTASGEWQPGDSFLLMSDALAAAFLKGARVPVGLTRHEFRHWLDQQRAQREIRNDDVSLLCLATRSIEVDAAA